jgi:putative permease
MNIVKDWFERYFSDPQVIILALLLASIFAGLMLFGGILAPVLASVVMAYLLEAPVTKMERWGLPRLIAASVVYVVFVILCLLFVFVLIPELSRQVTGLLQTAPDMVVQGQSLLLSLPERYPEAFTEAQVQDWIAKLGAEIQQWLQALASSWVKVGVGATYAMIYMVLIPFLVFFMLKDKDVIVRWFQGFLPDDYSLVREVWADVDKQVGNYVRGKAIEILVIGSISCVTFIALGLNYAMLLGVLVGLSVLVPYVGATVVTLPVLAVAYLQWGATSDFMWVFASYAIIQAFDGNLLVPLLFSEVVDLHPIAIIVAVLFFGGIWGFWGVFFAIPLATLVQAVLKAWPNKESRQSLAAAS